MATCSKCGGEVSTDQQICAACGTPAGSAAPAFQPVQPAAPAFQPVQAAAQQAPPVYAAAPAAYAAPAPAKSGPSALKIILIIVAIIVGLVILGVGAMGYMVYRVAHSVHVSDNGNVSMNGFGVNANSSDHLTSSDLGVDIYPGAEQEKGGIKMNFGGTSSVIGKFVTSDSKDAVVAFYKDKMGADATSFNIGNSASLSQKKGDQESVVVTITQNSAQADGKTQFSIQHTKKN